MSHLVSGCCTWRGQAQYNCMASVVGIIAVQCCCRVAQPAQQNTVSMYQATIWRHVGRQLSQDERSQQMTKCAQAHGRHS